MNLKKYSLTLTLLISTFSSLTAQVPSVLDWHVGFGLGLTVNGLPSQLSQAVAKYENYIAGTENEKGLPLGTSFFVGSGYKINRQFAVGFEYGLGYNLDMGMADIKIGDTVPAYVLDAFTDLKAKYPDFAGDVATANLFAGVIYPGLSVKNNLMKGSFFDQKFLIYGKWMPNWGDIPIGFQIGTGLKMIHPLAYHAIQSKNPRDYILSPEAAAQGAGNDLDQAAFWNMVSTWAAKTVDIPFPLKTTDGKVFMNQHQVLMDFSFRFNIHMFYIDVDYATEFKYIHNTKITLGVIFDSNILDSLTEPKN